MIVEIDKDMLLRLRHGPIDERAKMNLRAFFPNGEVPKIWPVNIASDIPIAGRSESLARALKSALSSQNTVFLVPELSKELRDDGFTRSIVRYRERALEPARPSFIVVDPDGTVETVKG